jgi:hypothetical protein
VKKVLFVAHEADRSGAPIALLRLLRWLRDASALEFEILLMRGGALESAFRALAPLEVIHPRLRPSLNPLRKLGPRLLQLGGHGGSLCEAGSAARSDRRLRARVSERHAGAGPRAGERALPSGR